MALTPETSAALKQAIEAIVQECGDDPQYAHLVEALQSAEDAIPESEGHAPEHGDAPERDSEDDDFSFETAEKRHKEARKPKSKPEGDDHENPFAKGEK